jgi:hypothetical protein
LDKIDIGDTELSAADYDNAARFFDTEEGEEIHQLACAYAVFVVTPPLLAERLRRRGDRCATARDFECPCYTDAATDRPICFNLKPACRFATPAPAPEPAEFPALSRRSQRMKMTIAPALRIVTAYLAASRQEQAAMKALLRRTYKRALRSLGVDPRLESSIRPKWSAKEKTEPPALPQP